MADASASQRAASMEERLMQWKQEKGKEKKVGRTSFIRTTKDSKENPPVPKKKKRFMSKKKGLSERPIQGNQRLSTSSTSSTASGTSIAIELELWQDRYAKLRKKHEQYKRLLRTHQVPIPGSLEPLSSAESLSSNQSGYSGSEESPSAGVDAPQGAASRSEEKEESAPKRQRVLASLEHMTTAGPGGDPSEPEHQRIDLPAAAPSPVRRAAVAAAEAVLSQLHEYKPPLTEQIALAAGNTKQEKDQKTTIDKLLKENESLKNELAECKELIKHLEKQKDEFRTTLQELYNESVQQRGSMEAELSRAKERIAELENNEASMLLVQQTLETAVHSAEQTKQEADVPMDSPSPELSPASGGSPCPDLTPPHRDTRRKRRSSMFMRSQSIPYHDIPASEEEQPPMTSSPGSPPLERHLAPEVFPGTPCVSTESAVRVESAGASTKETAGESSSESTVSYSSGTEDSPSKATTAAAASVEPSGVSTQAKQLRALRFENDVLQQRMKEKEKQYKSQIEEALKEKQEHMTELEASRQRQSKLTEQISEIQQTLQNSLSASVSKIQKLQGQLREEREQVSTLQAELRRVKSKQAQPEPTEGSSEQ